MFNYLHYVVFTLLIIGSYTNDILSAEPPARPAAEGERPLKRIRPGAAQTVPPLTELASRSALRNGLMISCQFRFLPEDCLPHMKPAIIKELIEKLAPKEEKKRWITSDSFDSKINFLKDMRHFINFQQHSNVALLFSSERLMADQHRDDVRSGGLAQKIYFHLRNKKCFRSPNREDSPRSLGFIYSIANQLMERIVLMEPRRESQYATPIHHRIIISPPLSGNIELVTPYLNSVLVKTSEVIPHPCNNVFLVEKNGISHHIIRYPDQHIIDVRQAAGDGFFIFFADGNASYFESLHTRPHQFVLTIPYLPQLRPSHFEVSPDGTKVVAGFAQGKMTIYETQNHSFRIITDKDQRLFGPMKFLDNDTIVAIRNPTANQPADKEFGIQIWDLNLEKPLAHATQKERRRINNLDIDSQKQTLLLGMGYFDIGRQTLDSFTPILDHLDPEKIFLEPHTLNDLLQKESLTLQDKLNFLTHYAKRG